MVDSTHFKVQSHKLNQYSIIPRAIAQGSLNVPFRQGGNLRLHKLVEQSLAVTNSGNATDDTHKSVISNAVYFVHSDVFNSTLKNLDQKVEVLAGYIVDVDHTTTSPDTDNGVIKIELRFYPKTGTAPTYAPSEPTADALKLLSFPIVETTNLAAIEYAGPYFVPLMAPVILDKESNQSEYLGISPTVQKVTSLESDVKVANTVITVYTFKIQAYAVMVDAQCVNGLEPYQLIDEVTKFFGLK